MKQTNRYSRRRRDLPALAERAALRLRGAKGAAIEYDLSEYERMVAQARDFDVGKGTDLVAEAASMRARLAAAENEDALEAELPLALALVTEAARRGLGLEPYDVQLIAGAVMCRGRLAELATGEGKTLAAVFPAFFEALAGEGVHVLTANDYLARRDALWMGPVYAALGLRAAFVIGDMDGPSRQAAYAADVTYVTSREAGFDYLRDGLRRDPREIVQRVFYSAVVDEADFLLIDEARVPLVIAARWGGGGADPRRVAEAVSLLVEGKDFAVDRRAGKVSLCLAGQARMEALLGIGGMHEEAEAMSWARIHAALFARNLVRRDVDYVIRGARVGLVDEFTGRVAADRRWPYGIQAAIEAMEGLAPRPEGKIYGTIPTQDFIRLYPRLSAMTATALPSAEELSSAFGLAVVLIPPNRPLARIDAPDVVYRTRKAKMEAIVREIAEARKQGRPVLVGTGSVRESEELSALVAKAGIACEVLNARNDELEAALIARAGAFGAVTISTAMAGRGTDIRLGGEAASGAEKDRLASLGGLYVIGTCRHESRRLDDQLRGRAGRQGEPGLSRFFLCLEDEIFELYGARFLLPREYREKRPREEEEELDARGPIDDPRVLREIDRAQRIIQGRNAAARRALQSFARILELDRRAVRQRRDAALWAGELPRLVEEALSRRGEALRPAAALLYIARLDRFWAEHLLLVDDLREGAGLLRYGGRDPGLEFLRKTAAAFEEGLALVEESAAADIDTAPEDSSEALARAGLELPTGTWTYLVEEESFPAFSVAGLAKNGIAALGAIAALPALILAWIVALVRPSDGTRPPRFRRKRGV